MTGKTFVELTENTLIERDDLKDRFFDYLDGKTSALTGRVYDESGVFGVIEVDTSVAGQFTLNGDAIATDGLGRFLNHSSAASYCTAVKFQNSIGVTYEISLHHVEAPWFSNVENTILSNPDTGVPEYRARMNLIGELGQPDDVQAIGDDIVLTVDGLCEAGVSHAGRYALVYLVTPQSPNSEVGLPIVQVTFTGGQNVITIETHKLGQSVISASAAHYRVVILGPTVRRNSSKFGVPGYVIVGSITDGVVDISEQTKIAFSLSNLNNAFASFAENQELAAEKAGPKAKIPQSLWASASCVVDSQIFSIGGILGFSGEDVNTNVIYAYDTLSDSWVTKLSAVEDAFCSQLAAARVGDIIYIAGGHNGIAATSLLRRYNHVTDEFMLNGASMPNVRNGGALVALGRHLYYIAGDAVGDLTEPQTSVYRYSIDTDSWSAVASLPVVKSRLRAVVYDSKIYVIGGSASKFINVAVVSNNCYSFDPATNVWTELTPQPINKLHVFGEQPSNPLVYPAIGVSEYGAIHVMNGTCDYAPNSGGIWGTHQIYSIPDNKWIEVGEAENPRTFASTFGFVDGVMYMFGGVSKSFAGWEVSDPGFACNLKSVNVATADGAAIDVGTVPENSSAATITSSLAISETRTAHSVCELGSGFLITGGTPSIGGTFRNTAEMYWPQTQTRCRVANMPTARAFHGSVEFGGDAIILSGQSSLDVIVTTVLGYRPYNNSWSVISSLGPQRSSYAIAKDGSIAYLVGGLDSVNVPEDTVEAWDLASMSTMGNVAGVTPAAANYSALVLDNVLYAAQGTSIRAISLNKIHGLDNILDVVTDVTLSETSSNGAIASWNGMIYVLLPITGAIVSYDPKTRTLSNVATIGASARSQMITQNGQLYVIGGSAVLDLSTALNTVTRIQIPNAPVTEPKRPKNFTTGKQADSVGFKAGHVYGTMTWSSIEAGDYTRMSAQL